MSTSSPKVDSLSSSVSTNGFVPCSLKKTSPYAASFGSRVPPVEGGWTVGGAGAGDESAWIPVCAIVRMRDVKLALASPVAAS